MVYSRLLPVSFLMAGATRKDREERSVLEAAKRQAADRHFFPQDTTRQVPSPFLLSVGESLSCGAGMCFVLFSAPKRQEKGHNTPAFQRLQDKQFPLVHISRLLLTPGEMEEEIVYERPLRQSGRRDHWVETAAGRY